MRRRNVFRMAKAAGLPALQTWADWKTGRERTARADKWLPSELACTLVDDWELFVRAYGKRVAERVLKDLAGAATVTL